jgi:isoquinoline 1-oxidoreductase beta subunit
MDKRTAKGLSRRSFLFGTAAIGAGVTVGAYLYKRETIIANPAMAPAGAALEWDPQAFVHVGSDNGVTLICKHTEMGQGIYTGMATVVAEEMDAAWEQMRIETAPADLELYSNIPWGEQATGGSSSLTNSYEQLRQVGAATRQMLISAASETWNVPASEITVTEGALYHSPSSRSATFGELADTASSQPVPETVTPKSREQYTLVGVDRPRLDVESKINGQAQFTQDLKLPGMLTAVVAHAPRFGGVVKSFNDAKARAAKGVVDVVAVPSGIAVIARDFWSALQARDLLSIEWDESNAFKQSSADIVTQYKAIADTPGTVAREEGSITDAFSAATQVLETEFEFPFLAHAPSEPLGCIVRVSANKCEFWNAAQSQTADQNVAAEIVGIAPKQVEIHTLMAGGAYGRRACNDYTSEAVHVAVTHGAEVPIKLMWTREDTMRAGQYRPMNYHRLRAGLNDAGELVVWHHRLVGQSIAELHMPSWVVDGIDSMSVHGAHDWLYGVPNIRVESHSPELPVPVLWYRGVGSTHTVFAVETFIDEIAATAGIDPVEFRLRMLKSQPRMANVARLAAEKADWGSAMSSGRARGIAICQQRETFLAQVAEVSLHDDRSFSVDRVITVVDCGLTINPDVVRAQMEGGTGFGLSPALGDEISFKDGYVQQSNFDTYKLLRIDQMPTVDVHIVPSDEHPTGVGELAPMAVGPAVANALSALTGQRYQKLPLPKVV